MRIISKCVINHFCPIHIQAVDLFDSQCKLEPSQSCLYIWPASFGLFMGPEKWKIAAEHSYVLLPIWSRAEKM